jgi:hypothetical protein
MAYHCRLPQKDSWILSSANFLSIAAPRRSEKLRRCGGHRAESEGDENRLGGMARQPVRNLLHLPCVAYGEQHRMTQQNPFHLPEFPPSNLPTETGVPMTPSSRIAAFRCGAWRGAKRGLIIGATYPPLLAALVSLIGTLFLEPAPSHRELMDGLRSFPLGVIMHALTMAMTALWKCDLVKK